MLLELSKPGGTGIEYQFNVPKKIDLCAYFKEEYSSVLDANIPTGGDTIILKVKRLSLTDCSYITFNISVVKSFNFGKQAAGCVYLDLSNAPTYGIEFMNQVPGKYYHLAGFSSHNGPMHVAMEQPWLLKWGINLELRLAEKCANLYVLEHLHRTYPDVIRIEMRFQDEVRYLAQQFSSYLDMAVGGELRHAYREAADNGLRELADKSKVHKYLSAVLIGILDSDYDPCEECEDYTDSCNSDECEKHAKYTGKHGTLVNREAMWSEWYDMRQEHGLPLLKAAKDVFTDCRWGSSFGGTSWGNMAKALIRYHEAGYAPKKAPAWKNSFHFVDTVWSLQHNGGNALNKVWMVPSVLVSLLDRKFAGEVDKLVKYADAGVIELWAERTGKHVSVATRIQDLAL